MARMCAGYAATSVLDVDMRVSLTPHLGQCVIALAWLGLLPVAAVATNCTSPCGSNSVRGYPHSPHARDSWLIASRLLKLFTAFGTAPYNKRNTSESKVTLPLAISSRASGRDSLYRR